MNQMIAQGNAMVAKQCLESAKAGQSIVFLGQTATCKDTASVNAYCSLRERPAATTRSRATQRHGGARVDKGAEAARYKTIADTGKLCGFAPDTVRKQLCGSAQSKKDWTFFAEECPESAEAARQGAVRRPRLHHAGRSRPTSSSAGAWSAGGASDSGGGGGADDAADGSMAGWRRGRADSRRGDAGAGNGNATVNGGENGEDPQDQAEGDADRTRPRMRCSRARTR